MNGLRMKFVRPKILYGSKKSSKTDIQEGEQILETLSLEVFLISVIVCTGIGEFLTKLRKTHL